MSCYHSILLNVVNNINHSFVFGSEPLALELLELLLKAISIISSMKLRHSGGCLLYEREHNTMVSAPSFMCPLIQFALAKREVFYNRFSSTTR